MSGGPDAGSAAHTRGQPKEERGTSRLPLSARALNRATLSRQLLLQRESLSVADAVRRVVALQAQQPASPYLALWNRLQDFDPAELDRAFAGFALVKSTVMRITLHAVHAEDYPAFREAVEPSLRAARLRDKRFTASGLRPEDVDGLLPALLEFAAEPRAAGEFEDWLGERLGAPPHRGIWWALRHYAPLWHVPTGEPWSFDDRRLFVAAGARPVLADDTASAAGLRLLVKRYLAGFGPASVADIAQFAMVQRARAKAAVESLGDELEQFTGPGGTDLYDIPGAPRPDEAIPAPPRLLPMWESILLAYADRSRIIPPAYRPHVTRVNGDVLPTLLVDGYVAGVWRPDDGKIEVTAFHSLPDEAWQSLAGEARRLLSLLATRQVAVYARYSHWWSTLPSTERRRLPED